MFSAVKRVNEIGTLLSSVLIALLALVAMSSLVIPTNLDPSSLKVSKLHVLLARSKQGYSRPQEFAFAKFDIVADLSPLFHWNTKQLFVYLVADYSTPKHPHNEIVIWDRIIRTPKAARVNINGGKPKYEFKEIGGTFKNVSPTFSLRYDVQPWAGALMRGEAARTEAMLLPPLQRST